jgi:hypothetical protein
MVVMSEKLSPPEDASGAGAPPSPVGAAGTNGV